MKLKELIHEPTLEVRVESVLKTIDWDYDVDATNEVRMERGEKSMKELKTMIGALHTAQPELAEAMWEAYCPYAQPGSLKAMIRK